MQRPSLPIDERLPDVLAKVRAGRNVVLVAEPGAGKTTRVPPALLDVVPGEIIVLEPRRLAARLAARRVAEELGEEPGKRVGWQVRFERVASKETRLRFVTEGVLVRELASRPDLRGVSAVVLDELHERHLPGDVALALVRHLQRTSRPDLRLIAMSATLDATRVAAILDGDVIESSGRPFAVTIEHAGVAPPSTKRLDELVAAAVARLCARGLDGDVLVFLPGAGEIRYAEEACAEVARTHGLEVVPLHGDLPGDAQDRAVRAGKQRKVILSTNVAESSITVPSVVAVIDSGLVRIATHSPWSGMPRLATEKACRASLAQRAGRAGRVRDGVCLRLYTKADHDARPMHDTPEILRADLAETVLALRALGIADVATLPWLDAPPAAQVEAASELLSRLGALDETGVTAEGRAMLRMPVHPRAARLAREASARGVGARGAMLAALIGERDPLLASRFGGGRGGGGGSQQSDTSDLLARAALIEAVEAQGGATPARCRAHELDPGATQAVLRARDQIARVIDAGKEPNASMDDEEEALRIATLAAFPDRVAKRRSATNEVVFAKGGAAKLAETCVVRDAELMVAVDAGEQRTHVVVRLASAIEPEMLLDAFESRVVEHDETRFDAKTKRVITSRGLAYDGLVLDASERSDLRGPAVTACLSAAARDAGLGAFVDVDALAKLRERAAFAGANGGPPIALDDVAVWSFVDAAADGAVSFAELRDAVPLDALLAAIPHEARTAIDRLAPPSIALPGGRRVTIAYTPGQPPSIGSRLQDFYGLAEGPRIAGGRVPLVLHLHAPNGRDVQITTDLAGFWSKHYPAIRKELMRKYPRHAWAEDPLHATPPAPGRRR